jgi:hypothetical protein
MDNEMAMQRAGCESIDTGRDALRQFLQVLRFLRRSLLNVLIIATGIAVLLGEAWVIEHSPLFAATEPVADTRHGSAPSALEDDAMPLAVLH